MLMKQLVFHFILEGRREQCLSSIFVSQFSFQQLLSLPRYPMMIALCLCMLKEIRYPQRAHVQNVSFRVNYNQGWGKQCFELLNDFFFFFSDKLPPSIHLSLLSREFDNPRYSQNANSEVSCTVGKSSSLLSVTQSCLICL